MPLRASKKKLSDYAQVRRDALLRASSSQQALTTIFAAFKEMNPRASLRWLATKAKIPSSGYLSEVLQGRRTLAIKHAQGITKALGFQQNEQCYFSVLLKREHESDAGRQRDLTNLLKDLHKKLDVASHQLNESVDGLFFAIEVFSAMSMFGETVELAELESFYGPQRRDSVRQAMSVLADFGMIEKRSDGRWRTAKPLAHYVAMQDGSFYEQYMRSVLFDSMQKLQSWFQRRDLAVFSTSVVSVDLKRYQELLPQIKQKILDSVVELEQSPADGVVRLNLQMFPISMNC